MILFTAWRAGTFDGIPQRRIGPNRRILHFDSPFAGRETGFFESVDQTVRSPAFHADNPGSSPGGFTDLHCKRPMQMLFLGQHRSGFSEEKADVPHVRVQLPPLAPYSNLFACYAFLFRAGACAALSSMRRWPVQPESSPARW